MTKSSRHGHLETSNPHWIEWLTGGLSVVTVSALLGWIAWDIYRYEDMHPDFEITVVSIDERSGNFRVDFDIHNITQATAAQVHVVGTVDKPNGTAEQADVTLDYVASESHDKGSLLFKDDPVQGTLALRVVGYTEP